MKTVTGTVVSSKPISLSKAASTLSSFLSADNGASKALCAYLRRASASFNELKQLHKDLNSSRSDRTHRHRLSEASNDLQAAGDGSHRIHDGEKIKSPLSDSESRKKRRDRTEDERDWKSGAASGEIVGEIGKRAAGELKIGVESRDGEISIVAIEKKKKKHKKKSEDGRGEDGGDDREAEANRSSDKSLISANNDEIEATGDLVDNNVARGKDGKMHEEKKNLGNEKDENDGKDLVELSISKKKNKKNKRREEDADDELRNNNGGTIEKAELSVSDSKELRRKEKKKRKNRDLEEEQGDGVGSEEQQGTKRRKRN